ncbi:MAG: sulfotransferase domain-containing protein [Gammaproteobacteria bacterium]
MIKQRNTFLWFKLNGLLRYALMHTATRAIPLYVVNEYPKSGGSWVGEMLGDALGIPFPRNRLPMLRSSILHGHVMQSWNMHNILIVWRDGRDVLVSQYFHSLFKNEKGNDRLVDKCRADLRFSDYDDVENNLPVFMQYVYEQKRSLRMSWSEFALNWSGRSDCVDVKYEDLRLNPVEELQRIVELLSGKPCSKQRMAEIVEAHSFERMSGRKAGTEDNSSFMRKGIVGDWKNYFNLEAKEAFNAYAGDALLSLGYEEDDSWVSR